MESLFFFFLLQILLRTFDLFFHRESLPRRLYHEFYNETLLPFISEHEIVEQKLFLW